MIKIEDIKALFIDKEDNRMKEPTVIAMVMGTIVFVAAVWLLIFFFFGVFGLYD